MINLKRVVKRVTGSAAQLEGKLLDYVDSEDLHRVMSYNPNFKPLTAYRPGKGMVIITQNDKKCQR